jgi:hypothetical protein
LIRTALSNWGRNKIYKFQKNEIKKSTPDLPAGLPAVLEGEAGVSRVNHLRGWLIEDISIRIQYRNILILKSFFLQVSNFLVLYNTEKYGRV